MSGVRSGHTYFIGVYILFSVVGVVTNNTMKILHATSLLGNGFGVFRVKKWNAFSA